jgi:muramoyltetrapeptide carboxypeptidase
MMTSKFFEFKPLSFRGEVAIVAPSSPFDRQLFNAGVTELKFNKIKPVISRDLFKTSDFFAGTDSERASLILDSFKNESIEAIWTARGGYGSIRLLEILDRNIEDIINNPKLFIGFSDVTALHSWLVEKCGFVTVHGPNITTLTNCDKYSKTQIFSLLQGKESSFEVFSKNIRTVNSGTAKGVVKGGNLSTIISLIGTPYEPDFKDSILFLEEVGEVPYRVDRMLTQMRLAGKFKGIRGLILGDFSYKEYRPPATKNICPAKIVEAAGIDRDVPVMANFPAGHGKQNMSFLLGAVAEIDTLKCRLRYFTD